MTSICTKVIPIITRYYSCIVHLFRVSFVCFVFRVDDPGSVPLLRYPVNDIATENICSIVNMTSQRQRHREHVINC